jgi:hypothetical protein
MAWRGEVPRLFPMKLWRAAGVALGLCLSVVAGDALAQSWASMATISGTLGNNNNRLCVGAQTSGRPDIGCPADAPLLIGGGISVTGIVSATFFEGDGSRLTNLPGGGGTSDRIVSGTADRTRIVAVSSTGYISITQNGTDTGWFDPGRGLVTLGVSATGRVSATSAYFPSTLSRDATIDGLNLTFRNGGGSTQYGHSLIYASGGDMAIRGYGYVLQSETG